MAAVRGNKELNGTKVIRFDVIPDDVLLDIFDFYMDHGTELVVEQVWQTLVHVCRRWRSLVFRSPRRLKLKLVCKSERRTSYRDTLDTWPALPLLITGNMAEASDTDNAIAVLGHINRVSEVHLWRLEDQKAEEVLAAMDVPFPLLTYLSLSSRAESDTPPVIPDSFLGGSAPHLRFCGFNGIAFPGLPNFLLSTTHLAELWLTFTPTPGYISPETMAVCLSGLSSLKKLHIEYPEPHPNREILPPKHFILPALEHFEYSGDYKYLVDLVARIDAPQLNFLKIKLLDERDFDIYGLAQFIDRTPKLSKSDEAHLQFATWDAHILLRTLHIHMGGHRPFLHVLSVSPFGGFFTLSTVKDLYIEYRDLRVIRMYDDIENTLWLQLLLPFTGAKNLYLTKDFAPVIATALQELVGDRVTEVLPSLQNIFVKELESFEKNIGQFVVARQISGHPISISYWAEHCYSDEESDMSDEESDME